MGVFPTPRWRKEKGGERESPTGVNWGKISTLVYSGIGSKSEGTVERTWDVKKGGHRLTY